MNVPAEKLKSVLGIRDIIYAPTTGLAITDSTLSS
jgi:hypothetical protein